jgi:ABC-type glycerol-3-phosphate transport system permease component
MLIPGQALTISLYIEFKDLGWVGTFAPILVPQLFGSAFDIFLLRQFFLGLPREIDESANIDGCGNWAVFWRMILPQAVPALIVVGIFEFLNSWRDAWGPLIYLTDQSMRTVPLGLYYFTTPDFVPNYPLLMAATVIAMLVPLAIYAVGNRYIDRGVVLQADLK